jgi:two-component system capsular synthesis response regulator RcsB
LKPVKVGVLDTHEIARYGLCLHLFEQADIAVVGSYGSCAKALQGVCEDEFDLLLIGHLPEGGDTVALIRTLGIEQPALRFLVLLDQPHVATAVLLMASGVHGIVCKTQPLCSYVTAIRSLANGEFYFCSRLILEATLDMPIAMDFTRSVKTFSAHKRAAYQKLGSKSDLDLFRRLPLRFS